MAISTCTDRSTDSGADDGSTGPRGVNPRRRTFTAEYELGVLAE